MRRIATAVLSLLSIAGTSTLHAQAPGAPAGQRPAAGAPAPQGAAGEIRGVVAEGETNAPVPRASVAVRPKGSTTIIAGAIANDKGAFFIQGLRPGTYSVRITSLGFAPRLQEVTISEVAPKFAAGTVKLTRVAVQLAGVTAVAERDAMTVEPDRNSYRAKDVAPAAANASEVLENVPSVQVDADGKVSYRGNENVVVQINGRPTPMRGQQLATYLKSLPAAVLERIEVIPNPSAKYDPEGMAGILNIQLKAQVDLGTSAGATVTAANRDRYSGSGNVGYQAGPWTTMLTAGHNADERDVLGVNDRQRFRGGEPLATTNQDLVGRNGFAGTNVNGTLEYKLNARDALTSSAAYGRRRMLDASLATYSELDGNLVLLDLYDRDKDTRAKGSYFDVSGGFRRTWDQKQKHELVSEIRFTQNDDEDRTNMWRLPSTTSAGVRTEGEKDFNDSRQRQLIGQLDYTKVLPKRRKLEAGYKGTDRWLDRDFLVQKDSLGTGAWTRSNLSNAFAFTEQVQAVYGVYSQGLGKFDLSGGLRAEYASRDFSLAASKYPYDYASLFPSAAVMYNWNDGLQYKASYSRRIRRPGTQELNPFPQFFDAQNVFIGNPALSPEYTDALELGVTRNGKLGTLQLSPFYRRTSNLMQFDINTDAVVDGRNVTTISFRNFNSSNSYGADLNGNMRLGPKLTAFGGVNVFKMVTDGGSTTSALTTNTVTWMARTNVSSQVTKNTTLQGTYMYRAPMNVPGGRFSAMQMSNFSVRQKVNGDKASVTLRVVDPFNTQRMKVTAGDANLKQLTSRSMGARAVFMSYQYSYGRPPRIRVRDDQAQQPQGPGFP